MSMSETARKWIQKLKTCDHGIVVLVILFLMTLPLINPMLRSDGIGYYAYVRSFVIDGDLEFRNEWAVARDDDITNPEFLKSDSLFYPRLNINPEYYETTATGLTPNRYSVGLSMLWAPFFLTAHGLVHVLRFLGSSVSADGYSRPYIWLCAFGSAFYGLMALIQSYWIGRRFFSRKTVLFSTIICWFATSLLCYMYALPLTKHAAGFFLVAALIYLSMKIRDQQRFWHWPVIGMILAFFVMINPMNGIFTLCLLPAFIDDIKRHLWKRIFKNFIAVVAVFCIFLIPHVMIGRLLYGRVVLQFMKVAIGDRTMSRLFTMQWHSPHFLDVLFSSKHGLFTWTPVVFPAVLGLIMFMRKSPVTGIILTGCFIGVVYFLGCTHVWFQGSSFGGRQFVSHTATFILGMAAFVEGIRRVVPRLVIILSGCIVICWNAAFILQFGLGLIPRMDYILWPEMISNQFTVVPAFLFNRGMTFVHFYPILICIGLLFAAGVVALGVICRRHIQLYIREL